MVKRIMIMAGGTGGHVFPALAVAEELRSKGVEVFWLGTRQGLEARIIPRAGIPMEWISISGLRGKGWWTWIWAPFRLLLAMAQALAVILRRRPMAVLGMGGFVTGPGGMVAWLLRKPLVIHEQNAIAGLTNRLLAPLSTAVFEAFPGTFHRQDVVCSGNPVRSDIAALPAPELRFQGRSGRLHVLVLGGSLGAKALNDIVPEAVALLPEQARPQVWHQTGQQHIEQARQNYARLKIEAKLVPFIDNMAEAYAWADLVICRAGALTIAELAAAGVGALLVPYPYAVDDHQTANADYLVRASAARAVQQAQLTAPVLREILTEYCGRDDGRERLLHMALAARRMAKVDATQHVAKQCLEVMHD